MNRHWYAINTKPHQEVVAETSLRQLGVETFCPFLKEGRMIRRKFQEAMSPLFPGYLFAKFSLENGYRGILYARGVKRVVAFGPSPAPVEEGMINGIRARLDNGVLILGSRFSHGQAVRIHDGLLHGLEAVFEREMKGTQRAVLLLNALSYQARIVVNLRSIVNL